MFYELFPWLPLSDKLTAAPAAAASVWVPVVAGGVGVHRSRVHLRGQTFNLPQPSAPPSKCSLEIAPGWFGYCTALIVGNEQVHWGTERKSP